MRESRITFAQQGVYIDSILNPEDLQYNNPKSVTFPQGISAEAVRRATETMIENHVVFFSHFEDRGGEVYQVYATENRASVAVKKGTEADRKAFVRPFDIQHGPLYRAEVIDAEGGVVLLLDMHHLVYDGASLDVMLGELCTLLEGGEIAAERHTYAEYAEGQPCDLSDHKAFYDKLFPQGAAATQIAGDLDGSEGPHAEVEQLVSTPEVIARAKAMKTAPSALFLAASLYTLSRYANSRELCLTTISNGRSNKLAEGTVGMFVHTLPVVEKIEEQSVEAFVHQVRQHTLEVRAHEEYPFAKLANDYGLEQHVRFVYQYGTLGNQYLLPEGELKVESLRPNSHASSLTITIHNRDGRPAIVLNYDTAKYSSDFVARFAESMDAVIARFLDNPEAPLRSVSIMSARQQGEVEMMHHSCIDAGAVRFNLFHESVEYWAQETPEAIALIAANETLTYRELNEQANRIAHALIAKGVAPGDRICLLLPRTSRHIIAMFGVMKAGAAYIPCDPEYPTDRIKLITEDSHSRYIITTQDKLADYDNSAIDVETLLASTFPETSSNPSLPIASSALAYLIYTSGSTGRPKGVMIPHKGICNYLSPHPENRHFHALVNDCKRMLSITTVSFDLSLKEIGASLYNGMTLVFADENQVNDPRALAQLMLTTGVDGFSGTPSRLKMFLELTDFQKAFAKCKFIVLGGEKYPPSLLPQVKALAPQARLFNTYGPTEISVSCNGKELTAAEHITIGRPLLNVEEYVVDEDGNELPVGVVGELLIGGAGVATGYNDLPEKTAEAFITYNGKRCYKSGDYAFWNKTGEIEILGRKDNQIKLNGLRIELGEVETVLNLQPQVKEGVVMIRTVEGHDHLVAYYVPTQLADKVTPDALKEQMGKRLTHYMVPTIFVAIDKMPLSPNGKTDLKALPQPELTLAEEERLKPATAGEQALFDIVAEMLDNSEFGTTTNLFSVGLTSLLAIRLSVLVGNRLNANLGVRDILRHPTIQELAPIIDASAATDVAHDVATVSAPLSFSQMGIYAECMANPDDIQYNIPVCITLPEGVSSAEVKNALAQVVAAHPCLDTHFQNDEEGDPYQSRMDHATFDIPVVNFSEAEFQQRKETFVRPFDLQQGPLYRFEIVETASAVNLLADFHHLVMDGASLDLFYKQLSQALDGQSPKRESFSYYQFASQQTIDSDTERYFAEQLAQIEEPSEVLADIDESTNDRATVTVPIDLQPVQQLSRKLGITPASFYLAALAFTVSRYSAEEWIGLATISNGRSDLRITDTFGMFVNTLPFVTQVDSTKTVETYLRQTSETFLETIAHEEYPYSRIVEQYHYVANILYAYQVGVLSSYSCRQGSLKIEKLELQKAKFPIAFFVEGDTKRGGMLRVEYNSGRFSHTMAQGFLEAVRHVVTQMLVANRLDEVELCDETVISQLDAFNAKTADNDADADQTVLSLFQRALRQYPDNDAVVFKEKRYTYKQLDEITDIIGGQIYDRVKDCGKPEPVVSILIPRNEYIPILPLAAMKAGCAYQPLDASYPQERLNFMVKDADAALLIADPELSELIDTYEGERILTTQFKNVFNNNTSLHSAKERPQTRTTHPLTPQSLFILLYTSGSTGVPKGVMLEHQNLVAFIHWYRRYYDLKPEHNVAAYASFGFDANMMDLYPALATGATTHIFPEEIRLDLVALNDYFEANQITHSFLTTQVGVQFLQNADNRSLKHLSVGGEKLVSVEPSQHFMLHNGYGPTECTIFTATKPVHQKEPNIPIGKPVDGLDCYVMDKYLHRLPVGAAGELVIVGKQVGRGYLNRPDKSAEAFFTYNGKRAYHSGDIVRYRPDGNIEFVGRKDGQVKIRGFRVEIKEIEAVVRDFPGINDATVQAFDDPNGGKFIAAYIVSPNVVDIAALNQFILEQKPPYMVPAVTMQIPEIPLNVNQKVDKKALPKPEMKQKSSVGGEMTAAPLNALEQELKSIIASVVNTEDFTITDVLGFVGLTSISSIKVAALVYKRFGVRLDSRSLCKTGTLQSIENEILTSWMSPQASTPPKPQLNNSTTQQLNTSPLTYAQQGVYMDCQMNPDTTMYNIPSMMEFPKGTSTSALCEAVKKVVGNHPALNCNFFQTDAGVVMRCEEDRTMEVEVKAVASESIEEYRQRFVRPFDLQDDRLIRAEVLTTAEGAVFLLLDVHHLVMDGSSLDLFVRQLLEVLEGEAIVPEMCTYLSFAAKQGASEGRLVENKAFFDKMFESYESAANVPPDRSATEAGLPRHVYTPIPEELLGVKLPDGVSQARFWFAAFAYTLSRFANTKDVFTAFISSGRSDVEISDTVGMFVNTLPCAVHIKEQTVAEYLQEVSEVFVDCLSHEDYPFSRIAADYDFKGCASFAYQLGLKSGYKLRGEEVKVSYMALSKAKVPFSLFIQSNQGVACVDAEFDDAQYSEALALHFTECVVATAEHFVQHLDEQVKHISIMSERQRKEVEGMHSVREDYTFPVRTFHEGIERWAKQTPDALALMACDRNMTYREYNAEANRLARALMARGLQKGDRVVLLLPRRSYYLTAMFAVMKCGGAFIPMDPDYPADRIEYILDDSEGRFVLTTADRMENYPGRAIDIKQLLAESATLSEENVEVKVEPHDLAYLIYTSGSTGRPKGVMIEHLGAASFLYFYKSDTNFGTDSNANRIGLCQSTVSFDLSVGEIGVQVFNGDTVVFANEEEIMSPVEMVKLCRRTGAQTISGTPSRLAINLELDDYYDLVQHQLKCVVTGGEKLPRVLLEQLEQMDVYIINTYGPTETTMGSSAGVLNGSSEIHVGKPFTNYTYQVLDTDRNELPVGVMGELCIGGIGLARGYNNMPERTAETFVTWQGKRIYRTGDYAMWTKDGNIIIMGRTDNQVKLNGLRIELGEIETVMSQQEGVRQCVAVIKKIGSVDKLVGYYTVDETASGLSVEDFEAEMRAEMSQRLTPYMVPGIFVRLEEMPLTPVGKTDVKRLPMPELRSGAYTAPKNEVEQAFCEIFAEALNSNRVGAEDNFFELGGTSLLAMQLIAKASKRGHSIIYKNIFDHPTPRSLAQMLKPELYGGEDSGKGLPMAEEIAAYDYAQLDDLLAKNRIETFLQGRRYERIGKVLVTGATGFLGIHVLENLMKRSDVEQIYCLVRGNKLMSATSRLEMLLFYYFGNTYEEEFGKRIIVVEGDVTDPHALDAIEEKVDVVYNCAANVKHFSAGTDIEDINLGGCENCIAYCLRTGARFIQTSTGSIAGQRVSDSPVEPFILTEQDLYKGQQLPSKYAASKFLAERAVLDAVKNRGLRGKVMRLGNLSARSTDGEFQVNFRSNNAMSALKAYQVLGCIPYERDCGYSEFSPINEVAEAIVLLSMTPDECTVFQPGNVHWPPYGDTIDCMNRIGIPIERVENEEFQRRLAEAMGDPAKSELVQSLVAYKEANDGRYRVVNGWDTKRYTAQVLLRMGFRWSFTSWDYIENYLRSIQGLGVFDADFKRE